MNTSGSRTLRASRPKRFSSSSPARKSWVGGMITPSWYSSVASVGTLPGVRPPTSWWWHMVHASATARPSAHTGTARVMSGR